MCNSYRKVLSKRYGGQFGSAEFTRFLAEIDAGTLRAIESPKCDRKLSEIVEKCITFDVEERLEPDKGRKLAAELKASYEAFGRFDFLPTEVVVQLDNKTGASLMKPRGVESFDDRFVETSMTSKESILPPSLTSTNFGKAVMSQRVETLVEQKDLFRLLKSPAEVPESIWNNEENFLMIKEHLKRFSDQELLDFIEKAPEIVKRKTQENYVYDFASPPKYEPLRDPETHSLEELFENLLDANFRNQFEKYSLLWTTLEEIEPTSLCSWDFLERLQERIGELEKLRNAYTKRFYFKSYFFMKEEWLFLHRCADFERSYFIRRDLNDIRYFNGFFVGDNYFTDVEETIKFGLSHLRLNSHPKMHYQRLEPIDLNPIIAAMYRAKFRVESFTRIQLTRYKSLGEEPSTLPVDCLLQDYVFQLAMPPRHVCHCAPRCPIGGGFPENLHPDLQVTYHECADQQMIDFIHLYTIVCKKLAILQRREQKAKRLINQELTLAHLDAILSREKAMCFHFYHKREYLLLDDPRNFDGDRRVPAVDMAFLFFTLELTQKEVDHLQIVEVSVDELALIEDSADYLGEIRTTKEGRHFFESKERKWWKVFKYKSSWYLRGILGMIVICLLVYYFDDGTAETGEHLDL